MLKPATRWFAGSLVLIVAALAGFSVPSRAQSDTRAWLGVVTQDIDEDLREGLDYRGNGVLVSRVVDDSPADRAGIRKGDVIVSVNNRNIDSPEELSEVIRASRVGQSVGIALVRGGARRNVSAKLAERDDDDWGVVTPRAPRAPKPPEVESFHFDFPDNGVLLRGMGRGRLGVRVEELNSDLAAYFKVTADAGVLVVEVIDDTPAERAGLKAGDVIVRAGTSTIDEVGDLTRALREVDEGKIKLEVVRQGATRTIEAELEARPRAYRFDGHAPMVWRGDRDDVEDEMRKLRRELQELKERLEKMDRD